MCLLGVSSTLLPILGVKYPQNPNFWGVNRRLISSQIGKILKVSCYRNYCIDFNQIWHNDKDHQVVIVGGPNKSKMADGRHSENRRITISLQPFERF